MAEAKNVNDRHAYNELQMAKEEIERCDDLVIW